MRRVAGLVLALALAAGCSSSDDDTSADSGPSNEEIASSLCGALVDWNGIISSESNEASDQVHDMVDDRAHSDEATEALLGSLDRIQAATDGLVETYEALGIPDEGEGGRMIDEVEEAVDDVNRELADVRDELEHDLDGLSPREILQVYFPDMEKVLSVAQPEAPDEGDDLRAALDADPTCDFTISR